MKAMSVHTTKYIIYKVDITNRYIVNLKNDRYDRFSFVRYYYYRIEYMIVETKTKHKSEENI